MPKVKTLLLSFIFLFPFVMRLDGAIDLWGIRFEHVSVDEGLANSIVYQVVQDGDGILWFGLNNGLDKYNGYDFKHYDFVNDPSGISEVHHPVRAICKISEYEFLVGAGANLFRYNINSDDFDILIKELKNVHTVNQINHLIVTPDSACYLGTNLGLFRYDLKTGEISFFNEYPVSILSLHYANDVLWVATGDGIKFFDVIRKAYFKFYRDDILESMFASVDALCFYSDSDKNFTLIGTRDEGLFLLDQNTLALRSIKAGGNVIRHIRSIRKYGENYLIGTDGFGLLILDENFGLVSQYQHDEDNPNSLSNDGIYDIHIDEENRIWVSTYGGGINLYDPNRKPFYVYRHEYNSRNSLRNNVSRSFLEVGERMCFGTAKGISILRPDSTWGHIPSYRTGDDARVVLTICEDNDGQIWIGTFAEGVEVRERNGHLKRKLRKENGDGPSLSTDYIYKIYCDHDQNIWMGGIRGGLMRYDPRTDQIFEFPSIQNVHDITESSSKQIMVGTLSGIFVIEKKNDRYEIAGNEDSILTKQKFRVFSILESNPGEFYIGTEGSGLIYFNRKTNSLHQYSRDDGLPSNIIYGILQDRTSNIWLSTTSGISCFDIRKGSFQNYTVTDGISAKDFNYGAYYKRRDGTMYFGSSSGVTCFKPEEIRANRRVPGIVFTGISVYGKDIDDPGNPVFGRNINILKSVELKHNQSSFAINFAAINYTGTRKNLYQWKISGGEMRDGEWTPASSERKAVFSYLPPGKYTFTVKASNNDGYWNEEGRTLDITVAPPFWGTVLAKIVYLVLAILVFIALQRYIITFINEKQAKEKISFFINVAHDIRTPLTLISAPVNKLLKSGLLPEAEKEEMKMAASNTDRLNNLVNQLLDFQKATLNKHVLQVAEYNIVEQTREILDNFQPLMDQRMINHKLVTPSETVYAWFDRQKIEKVLYNLVSNAIKYSSKGGEITVKIESIKNRVRISVKDRGRGIPAKQQKEIFKRYFRANNAINSREPGSGVGLMLSKKLMNLHRGSLSFNSVENKGSVFIIEFPSSREAYNPREMIIEGNREEKIPVEALPEEVDFSQKYTLLIVEDNPELRRYLRSELSKKYNILSAKNGREAFEIILKMDVDLLISDIMMPEMDGRALTSKVRNNIASSHIPIILLTALNSTHYKIEGLEYGADDYIEKPFDINYLKVKIDSLLKSRERLRKRFLEKTEENVSEEIVSKPDQDLMKNLNEVIKSKISMEDFSVMDICGILGMSRPVLYRKVKAYTGYSPQEYLIIFRLNRAAKLFREGRSSIKEVAYESGFSDPKHFSKSFKKHYGVNPSAYIKGEVSI